MPATPTPTVTVTQLITPSPSPTLVRIVSTPPKHGIDWGSFPAWLAAILTGGSLILGFFIILRDRRRTDKEQAAQVAYWTEPSESYGGVIVQVFNGSDAPVYRVRVQRQLPSLWCHVRQRGLLIKFDLAIFRAPTNNNKDLQRSLEAIQQPDDIAGVLQGKSQVGTVLDLQLPDVEKHIHYHLRLTDNASRRWVKCFASGGLVRAQRPDLSVSKGLILFMGLVLLAPALLVWVSLNFVYDWLRSRFTSDTSQQGSDTSN